jgi:hypothetical protein
MINEGHENRDFAQSVSAVTIPDTPRRAIFVSLLNTPSIGTFRTGHRQGGGCSGSPRH